MRSLPASLVVLRFLLGPLLVAAALLGHTGPWFGAVFAIAFLSDVFDGIIARRLGVATPKLREADSWVDACFCLCIVACLFIAFRPTLRAFAPLLCLWFGTDMLALAFDWLKFRRFAAYHAYSAKVGGLLLFCAVLALLTVGEVKPLIALALLAATLGHLERMVITAIMPVWTPDILTFRHALRLRASAVK